MTAEEATKLTQNYVRKCKTRRLQDTLDQDKILGWETNLFYQWVKYSARQVSQ